MTILKPAFSAAAFLLLLGVPPFASAHLDINLTPSEADLKPGFPLQITDHLFDKATEAVLEDPLSRSCEELQKLSHEAKDFLFGRAVSFQTPGMIGMITGKTCALFAPVEAVAAIRDPALLVGTAGEGILYYMPSSQLALVSNPANGSVAYTLELAGTGTAIDQFLHRRMDAERSAETARSLYLALQRLQSSSSAASPVTQSQSAASLQSGAAESSSAVSTAGTASAGGNIPPPVNTPGAIPSLPSDAASPGATPGSPAEPGESSAVTGAQEEIPADLPRIEEKPPSLPAGQADRVPVIAIAIAAVTIGCLGFYIFRKILRARRDTGREKNDTEGGDDSVSPGA